MKRKTKNKIKQGANVIFGALIFWVLIGFAFSISYLFGLLFFVGFIWEASSGRLKKQPFLAVLLFFGGLITRIAVEKFFFPILETHTLLDFGVAIGMFLIIYFVGHKVKKVS